MGQDGLAPRGGVGDAAFRLSGVHQRVYLRDAEMTIVLRTRLAVRAHAKVGAVRGMAAQRAPLQGA